MSEESPVTNPDLYQEIDDEIEQVQKPKKRKSRKNNMALPRGLAKMSGADVIEVMDFLHKRYLSWLTEAEASKYAIVYKTAKEEALKETLDITNELLKQMENMINTMNNMIKQLQEMVTPQVPKIITKKIVKEKSLLDDPRLRTTLFAVMDAFLANRKEWQVARPVVARILMPEAFEGEEVELTPEQKKKLEQELEDVAEALQEIAEDVEEQQEKQD